MAKIEVFEYNPKYDFFTVRKEFSDLMSNLGLMEWTPVVWICRLFALDNDWGEHLFDNWDERAEIIKQMEQNNEQNIPDENEIMVIIPSKFREHTTVCIKCMFDNKITQEIETTTCPICKNPINLKPDGPCHSDDTRKRFWTDVFQSLTIDLETIFSRTREIVENFEFPEPTGRDPKLIKEGMKARTEEKILQLRRKYRLDG